MIVKKVIWALMIVLVIGLLSVLVFARPPYQICCASSSDCVLGNECISSGNTGWDVDLDGDNDICLSSYWWDCGAEGDESECNTGFVCDGGHDCVAKVDMCQACTKNYECSNGLCLGGKCRDVTEETGLCSDGVDNDCDGLVDCDDTADCNCCGTIGNECCSGGVCTEGYCADGGSDVDHCCKIGWKWDEEQDKCVETTQCYYSTIYCPYDEFTTNWWLTDGCYYIPDSKACCNVGLKYGVSNYYDYKDADENNNIVTY